MTPSSSARAGLWIYSSQKRSSHLVSRSNAELCCMASLRYTRDALSSASPSFTPSAYPLPSRRIFLYLSYPSQSSHLSYVSALLARPPLSFSAPPPPFSSPPPLSFSSHHPLPRCRLNRQQNHQSLSVI